MCTQIQSATGDETSLPCRLASSTHKPPSPCTPMKKNHLFSSVKNTRNISVHLPLPEEMQLVPIHLNVQCTVLRRHATTSLHNADSAKKSTLPNLVITKNLFTAFKTGQQSHINMKTLRNHKSRNRCQHREQQSYQ